MNFQEDSRAVKTVKKASPRSGAQTLKYSNMRKKRSHVGPWDPPNI